jgi:cysteinyl-tRNA synthetase
MNDQGTLSLASEGYGGWHVKCHMVVMICIKSKYA